MIDRDKGFPTGLQNVQDALGERTLYDAVSQCSRCGYCEQSCPTYVLTGDEKKSPRGRNQLVRMLIEGKVQDETTAQEALDTCLLCSSCSTTCYASVPTADIVLEGKRFLARKRGTGRLERWGMGLLFENSAMLRRLLRVVNLLRKTRVDRLLALLGVFKFLGLAPLGRAARHVDRAPLRFASERLRGGTPAADSPAWHFFPACGTEFLFPEVGEDTVEVLGRFHGKGRAEAFGCCGLVAFNYGDLEQAKAQARRIIERFEKEAPGEAPVVADCSSCTAHLKSYPQMFISDESWSDRAKAFAARVRDAAEMMPPEKIGEHCTTEGEVEPTTYHPACRSFHGQGLVSGPEQSAAALAGGAFRELPEKFWCCGGAGAYAFKEPELSKEVLKRKAGSIAEAQAERVIATSTSCLIQLAEGLRKYYPEARVSHLSSFVRSKLRG